MAIIDVLIIGGSYMIFSNIWNPFFLLAMSFMNLGFLLCFNSDDRVSNFDSKYLRHFFYLFKEVRTVLNSSDPELSKTVPRTQFDQRILLL